MIVVLSPSNSPLSVGILLADLGPGVPLEVGYLPRLARRAVPRPDHNARWLAYYIQALSDATWCGVRATAPGPEPSQRVSHENNQVTRRLATPGCRPPRVGDPP